MAIKGLKPFLDKLNKTIREGSRSKPILRSLALEAITIIVRRTRLGYGVVGDRKKKLSAIRKHSKIYKSFRDAHKKELDETTKPGTQNLTFSGQMLRSIGISKYTSHSVSVKPKGYREDGRANDLIANINQKRGWVFMDLTTSEEKQLTRFYRKTFGDLVKKRLT